MLSVQNLGNHEFWIKKIIIYRDQLISCSNDNTIKFWELDELNKCTKTLYDHKDYIEDILIYKDLLISCSFDKTIKIWDLKSGGNNIKTLTEHTDWIKNILIYQNKLISSSDDKTIKIWDLNLEGDFKCLKTLTGHTEWIKKILIYEDKLISYTNKIIKIWHLDFANIYCIVTLGANNNFYINISLYQNKLIILSSDHSLKIWDLKNNSYYTHNHNVLPGDFNDPSIDIFCYKNKCISYDYFNTEDYKILDFTDKLKTITCPINWSDIIFDRNRLINLDHNIKIWNDYYVILHGGYIYMSDNYKIKKLKYLPYFEDYHRALETIFKIMNSKRILFRNVIYQGVFYKRELKLLEQALEMFNNNTLPK